MSGDTRDCGGINDRSRVLLVSYAYPPIATSGTVRVTKLAKYLPSHGWTPGVLTVTRDRTKWAQGGRIDDLGYVRTVRASFPDVLTSLKDGLSSAGVVKPGSAGADSSLALAGTDSGSSPAGRFFTWAKRWASFPDRYLGWLPFAVAAGRRELESGGYDAIWSTSPPFTDHMVASCLSRLTGLPWLADYRDPFTGNPYWPRTGLQSRLSPVLERAVMRSAGSLVTVSGPLAEDLLSFLGEREFGVHSITNGFDPDDFGGDVPLESGVFSLTYTGMMYGAKRDPGPLLEVIDELVSGMAIGASEIRVRIYGPETPELLEAGKRMAHPEVLETMGVVPRGEAIRRQRASTALLNLTWDDPYSVKGYGGKVFEYLGSRRPVLAWNPPGGVLDDLLRETGAGVSVANRGELKAVLERWIEEFRRTGTVAYGGREAEIQRYGWDRLSAEVAEILDRLRGSGRRDGCRRDR